MKKTVSVLLIILLLVCATAVIPVSAAEESYRLWVNNEQITPDHLTVMCGEGSATYDPDANTLILNNAQITEGVPVEQLYTGILSFLDRLTIVVNGDCTITETGGDGIGSFELDESYQFAPHDITVMGSGKLTIVESTPIYGYGIYCTGKLKLEDVTVDIVSAATGVWTNQELKVKNAKLNARCTSRFSGMVVNNGAASFENSEVTAESAAGAGILLGNNMYPSSMTVESGAVTLKGAVGVDADVDGATVSVNGGKLIIEAQQAAFRPETMLDDAARHILLAQGVGILSGAYDSPAVTIGIAAAPYTVGDVDGDGDVDNTDAIILKRYAMKWAKYAEKIKNMDAADLNRDGKADNTDAIILKRCVMNWKGYKAKYLIVVNG